MRALLSTWGSRGDVEPMVALAVRLREFGADVQVCAPPDEEFVTLLARVGVPLVPLGPTVRSVVAGTRPPSGRTRYGSLRNWSPRGSTRSPQPRRCVTYCWQGA
ncbi:glycosyltransferase [Actinomadura yumaensis]|uniref:glycosyltransferase n=1 Tax=Actinomadura yumaensis TaxID=111807 RepID=UPI00361AF5E3